MLVPQSRPSQTSASTPGDFKVVRDRHALFMIPWELTHEVMLRDLAEEVRTKQRREGRRVGF